MSVPKYIGHAYGYLFALLALVAGAMVAVANPGLGIAIMALAVVGGIVWFAIAIIAGTTAMTLEERFEKEEELRERFHAFRNRLPNWMRW